jgi:hypothetical protein
LRGSVTQAPPHSRKGCERNCSRISKREAQRLMLRTVARSRLPVVRRIAKETVDHLTAGPPLLSLCSNGCLLSPPARPRGDDVFRRATRVSRLPHKGSNAPLTSVLPCRERQETLPKRVHIWHGTMQEISSDGICNESRNSVCPFPCWRESRANDRRFVPQGSQETSRIQAEKIDAGNASIANVGATV